VNLSAPFVRRPIGTVLLTIGVALAGAAAFLLLPISPLPKFDLPTINVSANLPGASPDTMATSVAAPLERHLGHIACVTEMTSQSRTNSTNITLQFCDSRDIDGAARDVQAAINASRADLPTTLRSNPTYNKVNPADAPILILSMTSKTKTPGQIYDAASIIVQQQLSQVNGVGQVSVQGSSLPAVRVELNPTFLANYGLGPEDIRSALASANANRPKGLIEGGGYRWQIYTNDQGQVAADYQDLVVAYRGGVPVRLRDVAEVTDGVEDVHNLGLFNGKPAVMVIISRAPTANIISTVDAIKKVLPEVQKELPPDITMQTAIDRTVTIRASLQDVERTLVISIILVILVVLVFLRSVRTTIIPAVAVTTSLLGTFGVMYLLGFSLDNLSLMALTISTGFVVDDAIVVLENVARHMEEGVPRLKAVLMGAQEVGFTVLSISVSLVAVFIPFLLMPGLLGSLFREFSITLSVAILVSLVISLTTTPMLSAFLMGKVATGDKEPTWARWSRKSFEAMERVYHTMLVWSLNNGPVMLIVLLLTIILNVYLFTVVPKGFFPTQDTGQMIGGIQADQDTSFQLTQKRLKTYVDIIAHDKAVLNVIAFASGRSSGGFMYIQEKPKPARTETTTQVMARLRPKLMRVPGASMFLAPVQDLRAGGRQSNATYKYTLESDDPVLLKTWARKLTEALKVVPQLTDVNSDAEDHGLSSYVTVDRLTASRFKLNNTIIDNTLYDAFGQRQVSVIYNPLNQYHVIMEAAPNFNQEPANLSDIYLSAGVVPGGTATTPGGTTNANGTPANTPASSATTAAASSAATTTGTTAATTTSLGNAAASIAANTGLKPASAAAAALAAGPQLPGPAAPPSRQPTTGSALSTVQELMVPLSAVAHWADAASPVSVNHQEESVANTISFNTSQGVALGEATTIVHQVEQQIGMPVSVHGSFQGTAKVFQDSLASEGLLIIAALLAVYIVLGILYESYIHPLTVLSTLPSAGVGAVLALIVFNTEFSVIALIGVMLLIGIVKKNAIMIIDFALEAERSLGLNTRDAVYHASMLRFRPIMMTTFAAMFGALPLAIGGGEGAELRQPLGITIIGGLLVSQMLTLLTVPVVYLYLDRFRRRRPGEAALSHTAGSAPSPVPAE
jgi:multidrug efflux pump